MKAIMISIKPKWVSKILNKEKTIEIRKCFPKDYVGWVYIYVTKGKPFLSSNSFKYYIAEHYEEYMGNHNGKVVARFWCDKVSEWHNYSWQEITKNACLTDKELQDYSKGVASLYCIHITKLEIFDKPKELKNFLIYSHTVSGVGFKGEEKQFKILKPLNRAPQSWCYIED